MEKKRIIYIDYLKAISIFLVVLQHASAYYAENGVSYVGFAQSVRSMCGSVNVPIFFICAGFLCHEKKIITFYFEKLERILIPFITFATLKIVYANLISNEFSHGNTIQEQLFRSFIYGDVYWFCYAILLVYLLAPLMWKKNGKNGVTLTGIIIGVVCIITTFVIEIKAIGIPPYFQIVGAISHYPLFLFGYCVREYNIEFESILGKHKRLILGICLNVILVYLVLLRENRTYWKYPVRLIVCVSFFILLLEVTKKLPNNPVIQVLSKYSLQIMFFDAFFKAIIYAIIGKYCALAIWMIIPVAVLDVLLSVLSCMIIERIPYIKKLFGV